MATAQDLMPRETKDKPGVESALIRELAGVLNDTGLSEIEFERDGLRLRVARQVLAAASPQPVALHTAAPVPATPRVPLEAAIHPGTVKSPMVGTVYRSAAPGSAPFVTADTRSTGGGVEPGTRYSFVAVRTTAECEVTCGEIQTRRFGKFGSCVATSAPFDANSRRSDLTTQRATKWRHLPEIKAHSSQDGVEPNKIRCARIPARS